MVQIITLLFNWVLETEYIPLNFRRGVQTPLYKGKNTSTLEVNNYRGITLLSIFNKLFELVIWKRMEKWWCESEAISRLQGACRKGISCVHSAYVLQESISTLLETHSKVFVTCLDVSKAFDGVWIGGRFYRLWEIGIYGKTWRLFYNSYTDFQCKARVQNKMSEWYPLRCGIHQGVYLSLIKYLAFINSLLTSLEESGLCSVIYGLGISPLGYADDVASASTSKNKTDQVLKVVYEHSCTWRYRFNPKKSDILVHGENKKENRINLKYRMYILFIRTIPILDDNSMYKRIFIARFNDFDMNKEVCAANRLQSVTFNILRTADNFGLYDVVEQMLNGTRVYSKKQWRDIVWNKAWEIDNQDWYYRTQFFSVTEHLNTIMDTVKPLVWWQLGDHFPAMMQSCETMAKLKCRASRLKSDSYMYKNNSINGPYCDMCNNFAIENVEHLLMHCSSPNEKRGKMIREIEVLEKYYGTTILFPAGNNLPIFLGKIPENADHEMMLHFHRIVTTNVHQMYLLVFKNRVGIG